MDRSPRTTFAVAGHPIHPMLVPFPIACFVGTLITDVAYWRTADMQWANFSAWLLTFGLLMAALAAVAGIVDFLGSRGVRRLRPAWIHGLGNALALMLAILNAFIHSRDGYTSVVPTGLILSLLTVLILLVTGWMGWEMVYRHGVGVRPEAER